MLSCDKDKNKTKCGDCSTVSYNCNKEGGVIKWTLDDKDEKISGGYITANQNDINGFQHSISISGKFKNYSEDIFGITKPNTSEFGIGLYEFNSISAKVEDDCNSQLVIGDQGIIEIKNFDGKNASGTFQILDITSVVTHCMPDWWLIKGTFSNVPVY